MENQYIGLLVLMVIVAGFIITTLGLAIFLGPKFRTKTKQLPFECGSVSVGDVREQRFNIKFYMVAMSFILFDIEVIFLYPWAISLKELGWPAFWAMMVFFVPFIAGFAYELKKGVLDWNN